MRALTQRLQDESDTDLTPTFARRALDSAMSDLQGAIHGDDLQLMAFSLALSRLNRETGSRRRRTDDSDAAHFPTRPRTKRRPMETVRLLSFSPPEST